MIILVVQNDGYFLNIIYIRIVQTFYKGSLMTVDNNEDEFLDNDEYFEFYDIVSEPYDRSNYNLGLVERYSACIHGNQVFADFDVQKIRVDCRECGNLKNGDIIIERSSGLKVVLYSGRDNFVAFDYEWYEEYGDCETNDAPHAWESGANIITIIRPKNEKARKTLLYFYNDLDSLESAICEGWKDFCKKAEDDEDEDYRYFAEYLKDYLNIPVLSDNELNEISIKAAKQTCLDKICDSFIERNWVVYRNVVFIKCRFDALVYNREKKLCYSIVSKSSDFIESASCLGTVLIYKNGKIYDSKSGCEFVQYDIPVCIPEPTKADFKDCVKKLEEKLKAKDAYIQELKEYNKRLRAYNDLLNQCYETERQRNVEKDGKIREGRKLEVFLGKRLGSIDDNLNKLNANVEKTRIDVLKSIDELPCKIKKCMDECETKWVKADDEEKNCLISELAKKISDLADVVASRDEKLLGEAKDKMAELFGAYWEMLNDDSRKCIATTYMLFCQSKSKAWGDVDYGIIIFPAYKAFENEIVKWFCDDFESYLKNECKIEKIDYPSWLLLKMSHFTMGSVPYILCYYNNADRPKGRDEANKEISERVKQIHGDGYSCSLEKDEELLLSYIKSKWTTSWKNKCLDEIKSILDKLGCTQSRYLKDRVKDGKATADDYLLELLRSIGKQILPIAKNRNTTDHIKPISLDESLQFLKALFGDGFLNDCKTLSGAIKKVLEFIFPEVENKETSQEPTTQNS